MATAAAGGKGGVEVEGGEREKFEALLACLPSAESLCIL